MTKWEYRVLDAPGDGAEIEAVLNELGQDGWELIATQTTSIVFRLYVKRPQDAPRSSSRTRRKDA